MVPELQRAYVSPVPVHYSSGGERCFVIFLKVCHKWSLTESPEGLSKNYWSWLVREALPAMAWRGSHSTQRYPGTPQGNTSQDCSPGPRKDSWLKRKRVVLTRNKRADLTLSRTKATMFHQGSIPTSQAITLHHGNTPMSQVVDSVVEEHLHKTVFHSFVLKSVMVLSSAIHFQLHMVQQHIFITRDPTDHLSTQ